MGQEAVLCSGRKTAAFNTGRGEGRSADPREQAARRPPPRPTEAPKIRQRASLTARVSQSGPRSTTPVSFTPPL